MQYRRPTGSSGDRSIDWPYGMDLKKLGLHLSLESHMEGTTSPRAPDRSHRVWHSEQAKRAISMAGKKLPRLISAAMGSAPSSLLLVSFLPNSIAFSAGATRVGKTLRACLILLFFRNRHFFFRQAALLKNTIQRQGISGLVAVSLSLSVSSHAVTRSGV